MSEFKELPKIFMDETDKNERNFITSVEREAIKHQLSYIQLHRALMKADDWYFKKRLNAQPPNDYDGLLVKRKDGEK